MESAIIESDRALELTAKDILGRESFAKKVAQEILTWDKPESLVIALYGPWGSGKSSLWTLIKRALIRDKYPSLQDEELREELLEAPIVLEFHPWEISTKKEIIETFFGELAKKIKYKDPSKEAEDLSKLLKLYSAQLEAATFFVPEIQKGLEKLGLLAFLIVGFKDQVANWISQFSIPSLCLGSQCSAVIPLNGNFIVGSCIALFAVLYALACWAPQALEKAIKVSEAKSEAKKRTLRERKEDITNHFKTYPNQVLIVIDDIDRLPPHEIKLIFQLIKSNADFPRVAYLLLFQRDTVEKALTDNAHGVDGSRYLEKIVQVGLDVPLLEGDTIVSLLDDGLNEILSEHNLERVFNKKAQKRWQEAAIFVYPYLRNIRDLKRFLNSFRFHMALLITNAGLEVDFVDLLLIEVLRSFEPEVFAQLSDIRTILTGRMEFVDKAYLEVLTFAGLNEEEREARVTEDGDSKQYRILERIVNKPTTREPRLVFSILTHLFPHTTKPLMGMTGNIQSDKQLLQDRRASHPFVFDWYFVYRQPTMGVSVTELSELVSNLQDRSYLSSKFEAFAVENRLVQAIEALNAYSSITDTEELISLFICIFNQEEALYEKTSIAGVSQVNKICIIIFELLKAREPQAERSQIFYTAIINSRNLYLSSRIMSTKEFQKEYEGLPEKWIVGPDQLDNLKRRWVEHLETETDLRIGTLVNCKRLEFVLNRWKLWAKDPFVVNAWVEKAVDDDISCWKLLKAHHTSPFSDYSIRALFDYVKPEVLVDKLGYFQSLEPFVTDEQSELIRALSRATKEFQSGISPTAFNPLEDDNFE